MGLIQLTLSKNEVNKITFKAAVADLAKNCRDPRSGGKFGNLRQFNCLVHIQMADWNGRCCFASGVTKEIAFTSNSVLYTNGHLKGILL